MINCLRVEHESELEWSDANKTGNYTRLLSLFPHMFTLHVLLGLVNEEEHNTKQSYQLCCCLGTQIICTSQKSLFEPGMEAKVGHNSCEI